MNNKKCDPTETVESMVPHDLELIRVDRKGGYTTGDENFEVDLVIREGEVATTWYYRKPPIKEI